MRLYEISKEFEALYEMANEAEGDELIELYNELHESLSDKLENSGKVLKQLQADADALKAEEARLKQRRQVVENNIDKLKELMMSAMNSCGESKIKTQLFSFSIRASESVKITDESLLTDGYIRVKTVREPDKKAIKETLDKGVDVEGAEIVINESLQMR